MPDRIEREIEEILERLDDLPDGGRTPVPIASRKKQAAANARPRAPRPSPLARLDPAMLMVSGAVIMAGGLVLATAADAFIWLAFAGVVLFLGAFIVSVTRPGRPTSGEGSRGGVFWRDRYIEYQPATPSAWERLRQRFRRR